MVEWTEVSLLRDAPDYWPDGLTFLPPEQDVEHKLCLLCGRHDQSFRFHDDD
jgi:hypothetical protein